FDQIEVASGAACVLDSFGEAQCWGDDVEEIPSGPWIDMTISEGLFCALDIDGRATCWGTSGWGAEDVPE
ncbi:MAG: hypothetical protein HN348_32930, partial [Proteobacteria bacterium]|nr:hypothetical protein [Pseudomonadota bacterium]